MGQSDILDLLEKHKDRWFSVAEIKEYVDVNSVSVSLKKLRRIQFVQYKMDFPQNSPSVRRIFLYKHKEGE